MKNDTRSGKSKKDYRHSWLYEHKTILSIVFVYIVFVSIYSSIGYRVPILDEGVYVGMGKSMFSHGENGFWERFRPLGIPLITGFGWRLGFDPYRFSKIIAILFSAASIYLVYLIALKMYDKKTAVIASILFSITPLFMYYSDYALTEIPSMLFILIGIYMLLCDRYFLAGIMCGIGFSFKFIQGIFLIAVGIYLLIILLRSNNSHIYGDNNINKSDNKDNANNRYRSNQDNRFNVRFKNFLIKGIFLALGFILAITPYIVFNYISYHPYTNNLYDATIEPIVSATIFQDNIYQNLQVSTLGEKVYGYLYYLINMFANKTFISLFYLFFFIFIYLYIKEKMWNNNRHLLLAVIFITYLIYFTSIPYKQERFVYFMIPIAAIYTAYTLIWSHKWTVKKDKKNKNNILSIIFIATIASFALISICIDASFYTWKHLTKPPIVSEFYEYFNDIKASGTIATGDMVLAIYTDNKLTNMYELRADVEGKGSRNIKYIFQADYTYPCLDEACIVDKKKFFDQVDAQYTLLKSGPCYSGSCYIYEKRK